MTPTRSGTAAGAGGAALAAAGLAAGYPELLVLSFGCFAVLAAAVTWCAATRSRLTAHSAYVPQCPREGDQVTASVRVVNVGRRASVPTVATETTDGAWYNVAVPALAAAEEHAAQYTFVAPRRGLLTVTRGEIAATDPFGMLRTVAARPQYTQIRVHPRWHAGLTPLVAAQVHAGRPLAVRPRDDADFHSLRDYQRGDPLRLIHWPSTARRGVTTVRRVEPPGEPVQLLLLDNASEAHTTQSFEQAVRIAASLAVAIRRAGLGLDLRTTRGTASLRLPRTGRPGAWAPALDLLSDVQLVPRADEVQRPAVAAALEGLPASHPTAVLGIVAGRLSGSAAASIGVLSRRVQAAYIVQVGADLPPLRLGGLTHLRVADSHGFAEAWQRMVKR